MSAIDLAAHASKAAVERAKVDPESIDHVVVGNALQTSNDAIYGARHVGLKAGAPQATPAVTVNRLCGSGIESIVQGSQLLQLGEANVVLAGGMENMSQAPYVLRGAREGFRLGQQPPLEDLLFASLVDPYCGLYMAQTAEKIAKRLGVSREEQDEFAMRSHTLGAAAVAEGRFGEEIEPIRKETRRGELVIDTDDHIKPETSIEALAKLRPAFGKDGTVTAGNASGIVDGAAAVLVTSPEYAQAHGLKPRAKVRAVATAGAEPLIMLTAPTPASQRALAKAGMQASDIDLWEINEAFAAVVLQSMEDLGLSEDIVNVNGGGLSMGHPIGASGNRLALTLLHEMHRRDATYGVACLCGGGGQGDALVVKAVR